MPRALGIFHGVFGRTVRRSIEIIPALREMGRGLPREGRIDRSVETQEHAVVPGLMADERRESSSDMPDTMERAILRRIASPPDHAADIKVPIVRPEPAMLRTGDEITGKLDGGRLPDAVEQLTRNEPRAAGTEREMDEVSVALQGGPFLLGQEDLTAAGIILPSGQLQDRERRDDAGLGSVGPEVRADVQVSIDLEDGRSRRPVAFLSVREHEASVRADAEAVGVPQAGRQDFDVVGRAEPQDALIAR